MRKAQIFALSFLDGFTFAGVFTKPRLPGAPVRVFASEDSPETLADLVSRVKIESGSFQRQRNASTKEDRLHHRDTVER